MASLRTVTGRKSSFLSDKTVRVGYYFSPNFQEGADDSAPKSGYSYEYLQKIASYTGWKYEYIYGEWSELFEKLSNGEIDMMAGIAYSAERTSLINYPDSPMLDETFYIYKDQNDTSMQCGNISSYKGKKIGTLENDQQEMLDSLKNGEIDFVMPVSDGKWYSEQEGFVQSSSIVAFPIALVYKEPYTNTITSRIAVNKNNLRQYWYTLANYPGSEIVMYDTIEECIEAVKSGEADSTLLSALRTGHLLGSEKKLNIITLSDFVHIQNTL